jgi:hypothetical protein
VLQHALQCFQLQDLTRSLNGSGSSSFSGPLAPESAAAGAAAVAATAAEEPGLSFIASGVPSFINPSQPSVASALKVVGDEFDWDGGVLQWPRQASRLSVLHMRNPQGMEWLDKAPEIQTSAWSRMRAGFKKLFSRRRSSDDSFAFNGCRIELERTFGGDFGLLLQGDAACFVGF